MLYTNADNDVYYMHVYDQVHIYDSGRALTMDGPETLDFCSLEVWEAFNCSDINRLNLHSADTPVQTEDDIVAVSALRTTTPPEGHSWATSLLKSSKALQSQAER